jgi:hypothetical protein
MRRKRYFNGILTVNAALLAGLLWVQVAGENTLTPTAEAQVRGRPSEIPSPLNPANQRLQIIESLGKLNQSVEALKKQLESGSIKVEVTNLDQMVK